MASIVSLSFLCQIRYTNKLIRGEDAHKRAHTEFIQHGRGIKRKLWRNEIIV